MAAESTMGARASCSDGLAGVVVRTVLHPSARTVTHLVIEPRHRGRLGRLVPVGLVDMTGAEIRLGCTADNRVTHVLLQEGHLWGRKEVAIPVSAVASVDGGIRLNISKKQVEGLPPLGSGHP